MAKSKYQWRTDTHKQFTLTRPCKGCGGEIYNIMDHIHCSKTHRKSTVRESDLA